MPALLNPVTPAITREEWEAAQAGDKIKDSSNQDWTVSRNVGEEPLGHVLEVQNPKGVTERLLMTDMLGDGYLIVESKCYAVVNELNAVDVKFITD